jgi:hypothetical protein
MAGRFSCFALTFTIFSIVFSSLASRPSLVALTRLESGNGRPNALALLRTANIGRFNTTEARAGEAPPLISE